MSIDPLLTVITKYSHHFTVVNPSRRITQIIYKLARDYTQFSMEFDRKTRRKQWVPVKTYVLYVDNGREFRFHIGQFEEFMDTILQERIDPSTYEVIQTEIYEPDSVELKLKPGWKLYEEQEEAKAFALDRTSPSFNNALLMMPTGSGKAQRYTEPVKVPGGWKAIGELKTGDKVIAWDGTTTFVTGVFPQGKKKLFKITFEDGRFTYCCKEHLWRVYSSETSSSVILNTESIQKQLGKEPMFIDLNYAELTEKKQFRTSPSNFGETISRSSVHSSMRLITNLYVKGTLQDKIDLIAAYCNRHGTYLKETGVVRITSRNLSLLKGLRQLLWSIGAVVHRSSAKLVEKNQEIIIHVLDVKYREPWVFFNQPALRALVRAENVSRFNEPKLAIKSIEAAGEDEAVCISIDHPDRLYVTSDYLVTHNTVTSLSAVSELNCRLAVVVLATYVEKWIKDVMDILEVEREEIYVIQGGDSLIRGTNFPASGLPMPKVFVISISTMNIWYKLYEADRQNPLLEQYACMPYDFAQHLGIGAFIFDEAHQHPYAVFKSHLFMHVPLSISLSATLLSKDPTIRRVQSMMYPKTKRFEKIKMKKYITAHACVYQIYNFEQSKIRTTEYGQSTYSHTAFEKSIMANKNLRSQYFKMITDLAEDRWYNIKLQGDKLLIFVASRTMAASLVRHLKGKWPHLDIRQYLQENKLCDILEPDICVTTVLSGGTAIDIHGLRVAIQTINLDSPIQNVQSMGRLREIKHRVHDNDVHFYYLYSSTIPKHILYHNNKVELFKDRVLEIKNEFVGTIYP